MEIGVVVHGPGIIDSGWAMKIIDYLSNYGNVRCRLGGTMGRTAVIISKFRPMRNPFCPGFTSPGRFSFILYAQRKTAGRDDRAFRPAAL